MQAAMGACAEYETTDKLFESNAVLVLPFSLPTIAFIRRITIFATNESETYWRHVAVQQGVLCQCSFD